MGNAKSHAEFIKPSSIGYSNAPCQSVSVTSNTPRNPLAALGYKGNVGYIDQPDTSDVTVEEFLPADVTVFTDGTISTLPSGAVSLADVAIADDANPSGVSIAGADGCVLTGVTFNYTAGQPGRVTWSFLGKGGVASIDTTTPTTGTGADFQVLLWEDVNIISGCMTGELNSVEGVQSATFNGVINKDSLFALGTSGVYQYVTTFPINVTVSIESYDDLMSLADPSTASGQIAVGATMARECRLTSKGQSVSVGGYRTNTEQYIASDLWWYGPSGVTV